MRGIAILAVLLWHLTRLAPTTTARLALVRPAWMGWAGVDLFFVLSGYLITGILLDTAGAPGYFRRFYARRVRRIFPLYYGTLAVLLWVVPLFGPTATAMVQPIIGRQWWYWTYTANVAISRHGFASPGVADHFWSLAIEEQFYVVWPLLVLLLPRRALAWGSWGALALSPAIRLAMGFAGWGRLALYVLTVARLDAFAAGALIALAERGTVPRASRALLLIVGGGLLFAIAIATPTEYDNIQHLVMGFFTHTALAILCGAAIAGVVLYPDGAWSQWLSRRQLLRHMGRYSYAMYVVHVPVLVFTAGSAFDAWATTSIVGQLTYWAVGVTVFTLVGAASWYGFEARLLGQVTRSHSTNAFPATLPLSESMNTPN